MNSGIVAERFTDARTVYNKNGKQSQTEVADNMTKAGYNIQKTLISDIENEYSGSKKDGRNVGYKEVAKFAQYYGVSADFLLGLSPVPTTDTNLKAVCEFTGLSQKAVENISGKNSELLSDIFESNEFQQILKVFADAKRNCALLKSSGDLTAAAVIARAGLTLKVNQDETISLDHIPPIFSQALLAIGENGLAPVYKHQISELISSLFDNLNGGENNG